MAKYYIIQMRDLRQEQPFYGVEIPVYGLLEQSLEKNINANKKFSTKIGELTLPADEPHLDCHQISSDLEMLAGLYFYKIGDTTKERIESTRDSLSFDKPCDILPVKENQLYRIHDLNLEKKDEFCQYLLKKMGFKKKII